MNLRHLAVVAVAAATATAAQQPFQLNTVFRTQFQKIAIGDVLERPDGKIIVSGRFVPPGADPTSPKAGGLLANDGNWIPGPPGQYPYFALGGRMEPWGEDRFYVQNGSIVRRYWMDGTLDTTYDELNQSLYDCDGGNSFHMFPDGRLLRAGTFTLRDTIRGFVGSGYGLVWLNNDGSLDTTRIHRRISDGIWGSFEHIKQMPDGKFLLSGGSGFFEGVPVEGMFRVHSDGSLDTSFQVPPIDGWTESGGFLPQPGGKALVYGRWHFAGSPDTVGLVRFLPNGQLDPTFNNNLNFGSAHANMPYAHDPMVTHVEPIGYNMLAVTGYFDRINGEVHGGIAILDTAGNLLPGYFEGSGCGGFNDQIINPTWYQGILGIKPSQDGGYFIYGAYHGYDDGTGTDGSNQRLISKLYGLNVGIKEHGASQMRQLEIAPNPSNGGAVQLTVGTAPKHALLCIHDPSGRVVRQEPWPAGTYAHTLRAGLLAPGAYMVRVQEEQGMSYTGKLIVLP